VVQFALYTTSTYASNEDGLTNILIEARGLVKCFGPITALDGIDLDVAGGTVYALLGPNGAGKTTTINILTTLAQPSAGSARIAGCDLLRQADAVRQRIGVTFQDLVLDGDLSGRQVLDIHGRLYRQPRDLRRRRIAELAELVQLQDAIDRLVKTYSGGMKRRLELARGLMTDPQVLFLDEPTQGLDPQNRVTIWEYLRALRRERGLTLLLTTHYMEEAEALADVVGIIDHGRKVAEGTPAGLVAELGADLIRISGHGDTAYLIEQLGQLPFVDHASPGERGIEIGVDSGSRRIAEVVAHAGNHGFVIEDIAVARPSLGDVFLKYTGRALRD
jgi:ABC-2 type transport system ATP-binding protein